MLIDTQIDSIQREALHIGFDTLDMPRSSFLSGGDAWKRCRAGTANPNDFGIFDMKGLMFILGNLFRDMQSLCTAEILPWDGWGLMAGRLDDLTKDDFLLLDKVAKYTGIGNTDTDALHALVAENASLQLPEVILSYRMNGTFVEIEMDQYGEN